MSKKKYTEINYERQLQLYKAGISLAIMLSPIEHKDNNNYDDDCNGNGNGNGIGIGNGNGNVHYDYNNNHYTKLKKILPKKPSSKKNMTPRPIKPRGISVHSEKTTMGSGFSNNNNNTNNIFYLTHKTSFRGIESNSNRIKNLTLSLMTSQRQKQVQSSTAKLYSPIQKPKEIYWEPRLFRSLSTASIVPNRYSFPLHLNNNDPSKNIFSKNRTNINNSKSTFFDYSNLNDQLIRTDQMKKCLFKKRRYLQDFGLGMVRIIYQINQMIIAIEPFSVFTMNIYIIAIVNEDNLALVANEFSSFDRLISSLRYSNEGYFVINKSIKQLKYTTKVMAKEHYYASSSNSIETDCFYYNR